MTLSTTLVSSQSFPCRSCHPSRPLRPHPVFHRSQRHRPRAAWKICRLQRRLTTDATVERGCSRRQLNRRLANHRRASRPSVASFALPIPRPKPANTKKTRTIGVVCSGCTRSQRTTHFHRRDDGGGARHRSFSSDRSCCLAWSPRSSWCPKATAATQAWAIWSTRRPHLVECPMRSTTHKHPRMRRCQTTLPRLPSASTKMFMVGAVAMAPTSDGPSTGSTLSTSARFHSISIKSTATIRATGRFAKCQSGRTGVQTTATVLTCTLPTPDTTKPLFEITVQSAMGTFYDISIIPPGCTGDMLSLAMCKNQTGKVGFNVAMAVTPLHSICVPLTCYADACPDAYHFPKDDGKNHGCVSTDAIYQVTFCPPVR
ncbi:hypothetical protein H310_14210 [Aphanomyces invadans]|uniref:Uncharacterized protein n=1 Tax=Aphanomyces invadans TaxID=157072 RepID=A0A024TAS0_9STRA|nr:hypothetical protein H310_14210 [Aphanomyces invadans]ETV91114.1 hypothetical protein H310_14210 [Aphanomyces invadans]|eukprot:XP_008880241.1 hypothetical protein H310_14210 [Aphanomyces invadans]